MERVLRHGHAQRRKNHLLSAHQPSTRTIMNVEIADNSKAATILKKYPVPRGATHFRFTAAGRKPVIDTVKNIDVLVGCKGTIEYGKVKTEGKGKNAKVIGFIAAENGAEKDPKARVVKSVSEKPASAKGGAKLQKILGFSACAVAKALGKAGIMWEEADKIMRAHGNQMPKASLSVQMGFGRRPTTWERHGQPAPLTDEQIEELRKQVA
jgi:hypothetical protein